MTENRSNPLSEEEHDIDIAALLQKYLRHWKMFLVSLIVCISLTITYLIVTNPEYGVSAKILFNDDKKTPGSDLMSAFSDMGMSTEISKNVENETEILKSRSLMMMVSDSLNLRVNYFSNLNIRKFDLYHKAPVIVKYKGFNIYDKVSFTVDYNEKEDILSVKDKKLKLDKKVRWGETINTLYGSFAIYQNPRGIKEYPLEIEIKPIQIIPLIVIDPTSKRSSVLELSLQESNSQKATDIINTLIYFYNHENLIDKNIVTQNTIDFINSRLVVISSELDNVERELESYKRSHELTDLKLDATASVKTNSEYDEKISEADLQLSILGSIKSYLENKKNKDNIVPTNLGIEDLTLVALIRGFNEAQLLKAQVTQGMKPGNPVLESYQKQTENMRQSLLEAITNMQNGTRVAHKELNRQGRNLGSKVANLATQEREYRELARQQKIKETLYIFLLQKREENTLLLSSVAPGAKIIDATFVDPKPVSPRKIILLFVALIFSFLIPALILYFKELMSYKLVSKEELLKLANVPFLGEIPTRKDQSLLRSGESGSILSEQFRLNGANIDFMLPKKATKNIMITSTLSGEGKTFYASNLAISLANIGKKVLLINLDIHKTDIVSTFKIKSKKGITNYLSDSSEQINDIIAKATGYDTLYILPAGHIPPNPGLLLMSPRLPELFTNLDGQFDYIIIDTPPVGLLADAMLISKHSDITIYVVRCKYTPKKAVKNLNILFKSNQLHNMSVVLNGGDTKHAYGKYYNKYYKNKDC